jgi:hypothetical protein
MAHFKLEPNKTVGLIKAEIREAILDGKIPNKREDAIKLMIEIGSRIGLQ